MTKLSSVFDTLVKLEPTAVDGLTTDGDKLADTASRVSIAISLKRIADMMEYDMKMKYHSNPMR